MYSQINNMVVSCSTKQKGRKTLVTPLPLSSNSIELLSKFIDKNVKCIAFDTETVGTMRQ